MLEIEHKQVYIHCPWNDQEIGIDEDIVELIKELWRLDIRTTTCCQDASHGKKPDRDVWIDLEYDSFPAFSEVITETLDIKWHIQLRPSEASLSMSTSFPGKQYGRILSYFKKQERLMMKDFSRIIPKYEHEDWMPKLSQIGDAKRIIDVLLRDAEPKNPNAKEDVEHLRSLLMTYSDYHGIGILTTPYFIVVVGTFPILLEEKRVTKGG